MAAVTIQAKGSDSYRDKAWAPGIWYKSVIGFDTGNVQTGASQATYALFNVPVGLLVTDVIAMVKVAWNSSVTLILGDGTNDDGFLTSTHIAPQTDDDTNGIPASSKANDGAFAHGRYYGALDTIDCVVAGANPSAGNMEVYVHAVRATDMILHSPHRSL
jgi:hypothetical protein